ncbi:MAG TPA: radical SAM protein [Candidatus Wallbacteria bacterium]|nr:MAG: Anaerobic sulfatase-maturating enzyme [bacterium ADurb.Bin243]HPG59896.1 radical SAM protein [Candidatus Wallbacteria bacterium]
MIGVSKLLCGLVTPHDVLRYGRNSQDLPSNMLQFSRDKKPIVVWNSTKACNLGCKHCYISANQAPDPDELTTSEAMAFIDDIAFFGAPTLLFSGGEPLTRHDLFDLGKYAKARGLRTVISTNGTLIDETAAGKIKEAGFSYVGVSLDGLRDINDHFRGLDGAFDSAMEGIKNCLRAGVKVGLRFTINRANYEQIPDIFDIMAETGIPRICFYHLVYSGRGNKIRDHALTLAETRRVSSLIFNKTVESFKSGRRIEVLTVDNHCDGVYLYLRALKENPERAAEIYTLLEYNGGNNSGIAISCVDQHGNVHPDQFWRHYSFGNVKKRPFSQIWPDVSDDLMAKLKDRKSHLKGRCSVCKFLNICNGNFRVRAESVFGDIWAPDPACYLTDAEIGLDEKLAGELERKGQLYRFDWFE